MKEPNSYVFTSEAQHTKPLIRVVVTKDVNKIMRQVSNQRKTTIKKYFIEVIQLLQKYDLIENNYKYISQGNVYKTPKLDVKNISEGFILYEKLVI